MPLYMDRHDVSETVTAENVAELHQQDLKIQHKFNCNGLTYWFDEKRKTAFCLIEAPNEQAIEEMHRQAHGEVPHKIIEVDPTIVESFLGRIEDPEKAQDTELNIINDPAFRVITMISIQPAKLNKEANTRFKEYVGVKVPTIVKAIQESDGRVVRSLSGQILASHQSVTKAVENALRLLELLNVGESIEVKIAICTGVPFGEENKFFEKSVTTVSRLTEINKAPIIITKEVHDLFTSENRNQPLENKAIFVLPAINEAFLNQLMDFMDNHWNQEELKVEDFNRHLGMSKAQLYRKMKDLIGKSPSTFLRGFRLDKALGLLDQEAHTISEITFLTGYNSPSYFSKCFQQAYGVLPSEYARS